MVAAVYFGHEVPLTDRHLATLRSPLPNAEEQLIAEEERRGLADVVFDDLPGDWRDPRELPQDVLALILDFLPREEAYLLEPYFFGGQYQSTLASNLGTVKQSVQYRIHRALERLAWASQLRTWQRTDQELRRDLGDLLGFEHTRVAVVLWRNHWNQSRTAQALGVTQSDARVQIMRIYQTLKCCVEGRPEVADYLFDLVHVVTRRAWNMGVSQHQRGRAIEFPKAVSSSRTPVFVSRIGKRRST